MPSAARLAACFAIGAVAGTLLDGLHLLGDVLSYEDEAFGEWAWFVPLEFGLAGLGAGIAIPWIERAAGPPEAAAFQRRGSGSSSWLLFTALYGATALWDGDGAAVAAGRPGRAGRWCGCAVASVPGDWAYAADRGGAGPARRDRDLRDRRLRLRQPRLRRDPHVAARPCGRTAAC